MNLIALAVPFFILSVLAEFLVDRWRRTGYYRSNDAINSISAGTLSQTTGYFTKVVAYTIWAFVLSNLALIDMDRDWFDSSTGGILLWVVAAVLWDFCYYWKHRLGHEISILWAAHAVHHQSEEYNLSTALRQSSSDFLFGWIFYLPLFVIGFPADVLVTVGAINLLYQFWVHTRFIDRLGVFDRIFVTPSNHRVHHAQNGPYIDKNYGGIFVVWDRIFGTFAEESYDEPVIFGVRKPLANWNPVWANLQVYNYLWFDAVKTRHWYDKIGLWFRRTGWRPADMEMAYPKPAMELSSFRKFDPPISRSRRRYVIAQFLVAMGMTLFIYDLFANGETIAALIPCSLLWVHLYALGLLSEDRAYASRFEFVRLFLIVPIGLIAMSVEPMMINIEDGAAISIYILVSTIWLKRN
ncbi:MAG: sterol desaturase family protein [Woeseiaceae bacterium]|jgi:sterol desaturase/sphingolipid hydroxylase (fatty acid hydroxylase superfamily)|nr:sterol desaturase family protein [Woeseiaceae bacterium]